jgi:putative heme iron utilization protein
VSAPQGHQPVGAAAEPRTSPDPVVIGPEPSDAERARTLVTGRVQGTLGTVAREPAGTPFVSVAPFGIDEGGAPVLCISEMAEHTMNLRVDDRCSLLVNEIVEEGADPLAAGRVTLLGTAAVVPDARRDDARAAHLAGNPHAAYYVDFGDFHLWRMTVESVRFVGGYGRMSWVSAQDWATARPDPVSGRAGAAIEHLNEDHADSLLLIAQVTGGRSDATTAAALGLDRYGLDLLATGPSGAGRVRVPWPAEVTSPAEIRAASVALVEAARAVGA